MVENGKWEKLEDGKSWKRQKMENGRKWKMVENVNGRKWKRKKLEKEKAGKGKSWKRKNKCLTTCPENDRIPIAGKTCTANERRKKNGG